MLVPSARITITSSLAATLTLTFQVVEYLGRGPPPILVVYQAHLWHDGELVCVVIDDADIDSVVTSLVGKFCILFEHPQPCRQVFIQLVVHLVEHHEPQLCIGKRLDEVRAVVLVTAIGAGRGYTFFE